MAHGSTLLDRSLQHFKNDDPSEISHASVTYPYPSILFQTDTIHIYKIHMGQEKTPTPTQTSSTTQTSWWSGTAGCSRVLTGNTPGEAHRLVPPSGIQVVDTIGTKSKRDSLQQGPLVLYVPPDRNQTTSTDRQHNKDLCPTHF